jgi:mRNA interferase MazF
VSRGRWREIWYVDHLGDPVGHEQGHDRLVVVVSHDDLNRSGANLVIVVPITTTPRDVPWHVELESTDTTGLDETSHAQCEQLRVVSNLRLTYQVGLAPFDDMRRIRAVLDLLLAEE